MSRNLFLFVLFFVSQFANACFAQLGEGYFLQTFSEVQNTGYSHYFSVQSPMLASQNDRMHFYLKAHGFYGNSLQKIGLHPGIFALKISEKIILMAKGTIDNYAFKVKMPDGRMIESKQTPASAKVRTAFSPSKKISISGDLYTTSSLNKK